MGDGVSKPIKPNGVEDSLFSKVTESKEREAPSTPRTTAAAAPGGPVAVDATPSAVARRENADAVFKSFQEQLAPKMQTKMTVDDFQLLVVVGKGSFGKVMQVKLKETGQIFAMKILKKKELARRNQVEHTQTERLVMAKINHPFIIPLRYAFQTTDTLYMVLDYFNGGELFFHLKKEGRFSEERSRFYAAQITLALQELHRHNIIYRDLKPENILLDSDGNVMITDFGLSKHLEGNDKTTHTFCGTPEYLAPEILQQRAHGHGKEVDWWSFGTLLFEMMTGLPPFYDDNVKKMYDQILHATIPFPEHLSMPARDLFCRLLQRDPSKRLGSGPNDAEDVKSHHFFAGIDWKKLYKKQYRPPYRPTTKNAMSTENIDEEFLSETPRLSPHSRPDPAVQHAFPDFTYAGDDSALRAAAAQGGAGGGGGMWRGGGTPLSSAGGHLHH